MYMHRAPHMSTLVKGVRGALVHMHEEVGVLMRALTHMHEGAVGGSVCRGVWEICLCSLVWPRP